MSDAVSDRSAPSMAAATTAAAAASVAASVHLMSVDQLAAIIKNRVDKVLIIDSRSFLEFNTCHVLNSVNVCCSKIVKRRLQQDKVSVKEFLTHSCQIDADESYDVIVYDQNSSDAFQLAVDSFVHVLLQKLTNVFKSVNLLQGGFLEFQASHPCLCEDKTRKCAPMTSLSQPCMSISNQGPTRILPFLYLGSQHDALDKELLKNYNITYELNVSSSCPQPEFLQEGHFLRIPVNDNYSEKLLPYFPRAFQFLDKVQEANGCVLVHCLAGISRSPTVAIAYVMQHLHMTSDEAYRYVKSKRATISPNFNFLGQLLEFERQLQAENLLLLREREGGCGSAGGSDGGSLASASTATPFAGSGPKRQCRTDMRSATAKLSLNLNLPLTATTLDSYVASPEALLMPRPGDQSPTTGIAKLSFHTTTGGGIEGDYDSRRSSKFSMSSSSSSSSSSSAGSVFKTTDGHHETKFSQTSRYSSKSCRFASLTSLKEEASGGGTSMSSSSVTKRFVTSQVQILKAPLPAASSLAHFTDVDMKWLPAKEDNAGQCSSTAPAPTKGRLASHQHPVRETLPSSVSAVIRHEMAPAPLSMEVSRDSLTESMTDSLTSSSHFTTSSMCSSWAMSDSIAPADYCRSDSTSTSGLGSEISDLDSAIDGQAPAWPRSMSPKRAVVDDDSEVVVLRKPLPPPCFLLPGPIATHKGGGGNGRYPEDRSSRDSGNPLSPRDGSSLDDNCDKSRRMFGFWENASGGADVVASHDSGIVTSPTWLADGSSSSESATVKLLSSSSSKPTDKSSAATATMTSVAAGKKCPKTRTMTATTTTVQEAWSALVARNLVSAALLGSSGGGDQTKADGLYRAQSCPGILTWLQQSSPTTILAAAATSRAQNRPRLRKLDISSLDRLHNRYSCGDLIFDSCPDFSHFARTRSMDMGNGGSSIDADRTPISPTHTTAFGGRSNARVIPVS